MEELEDQAELSSMLLLTWRVRDIFYASVVKYYVLTPLLRVSMLKQMVRSESCTISGTQPSNYGHLDESKRI